MSAAETTYDAFLSYSGKEHRAVARVQQFLESFRFGMPERRVRVYLDRTDIRGGELGTEIRGALERSRALIVCWSRGAAESHWVQREIDLFRELHGERNIALALLGDRGGPVAPPASGGAEWRVHDLRAGWLLGMLRPHARLELQRLLAFVTGVELRVLRNWHLRRTLRNAAVGAAAAIMPAAALLSMPVGGWAPLELRTDRGEPLQAVAAEARDGKLWATSQSRTWSGEHPRNALRTTDNALDPKVRAQFEREPKLALRNRLVPVPLLARSIASRLPSRDAEYVTSRATVGVAFAGEPRPGRLVLVQPLVPTAEEKEQLEEAAAEARLPVPKSAASLVVVSDADGVRAAEVPGLAREWVRPAPTEEAASPAKGIAVAWAEDGQLWLGVACRYGRASAGLWHSPDAGRTWRREEGFSSVASVALRSDGARPVELIVAESYFERLRNASLTSSPSRVVRRTLPSGAWSDAGMPPFGNRSEIEFCGTLDGSLVVRVDTAVFQFRPRPLLRVLADG